MGRSYMILLFSVLFSLYASFHNVVEGLTDDNFPNLTVIATTESAIAPPTIDIASLIHPERFSADKIQHTKDLIREASEKWGFYNIINHSISNETLDTLQTYMKRFFALPKEVKSTIRRNRYNSRGYADNEYTKQIIDLKEVFDIGQLSPYNATMHDISATAVENQLVDGVNYWLDEEILPNFRAIIEDYYEQSYHLSSILINAIIDSLGECFLQPNFTQNSSETAQLNTERFSVEKFAVSQEFFNKHFNLHSSIMRLNYYPIPSPQPTVHVSEILPNGAPDIETSTTERLGISRHTDAGAITILLQDVNVASLEVYSGTKQDENNGQWVPVLPVANALTINSGDMLQVWTNNRFKAPEHRVRATKLDSLHPRYSVAFFLNPNYDSIVRPYPCRNFHRANNSTLSPSVEEPFYRSIRWGDFRSLRYLGDYEDVGEEIQIEKYRII